MNHALGIWCMVVTIFALRVQMYNFLKVPSGIFFNYVSVYPAVALTLQNQAVGAITLARVYAAG